MRYGLRILELEYPVYTKVGAGDGVFILIQQYVMAEAERIEKKFKYGVEESDQTHFEQYAENWLKRQEPFFKATTYAGYKRNLDIVSTR